MSNLNITFVTPWYGSFAGGAEVAVRTLAEQLTKRGYYVQVLTTCCASPFTNWWKDTLPPGVETINGVVVRRFPVQPLGEESYHEVNYRIIHGMEIDEQAQQQFVQSSINSKALIDYATSSTQDHLVIGLPYTQGLIYSLAQALDGRASIMPCFHNEPQFRWKTTAELLVRSKQIFFLAEEEKTLTIKQYGHLLGRKVVESPVIGVGVELSASLQYTLASDSALKDAALQYNLPEKFFVYVGRKDVGKNCMVLIDYFKFYRSCGGEATLVFVGGGDSSLVPLTEGFSDLGFIPEEDKYSVISQALALVNLSRNESFSIAIMEAWLCEVPVIVDEQSEVTTAHCKRSKGGIAISSKEEFKAALDILSSRDIGKRLAKFGKRYVQANYSWGCVIDRFLRGVH